MKTTARRRSVLPSCRGPWTPPVSVPREDWRAGEWIDPAQPVILYHGRVDRRKGALDLLDAFATLRQRGHPLARRARLLYSGIGPDSAAVAERVQTLGLEDAYTSLGYVNYDDVPAVYRRADVFASPTYSEGFSNTILEAMSAGLPIVSCHAVGVVDCLRDGENGLLVPAGRHPFSGRRVWAACSTTAPLRRRLAECAFEEVHRLYSWPVVARQIAGVYEHVRGDRARQRLDAARSAGPGLPLPRRAASALKLSRLRCRRHFFSHRTSTTWPFPAAARCCG